MKTKLINDMVTIGGQFVIYGNKIKIAGDDPSVGVYFVSVTDPTAEFKVEENLAENCGNKLIGLVPDLYGDMNFRLVIKTQFAGSGTTFLKAPRVITSSFTLEKQCEEGGVKKSRLFPLLIPHS